MIAFVTFIGILIMFVLQETWGVASAVMGLILALAIAGQHNRSWWWASVAGWLVDVADVGFLGRHSLFYLGVALLVLAYTKVLPKRNILAISLLVMALSLIEALVFREILSWWRLVGAVVVFWLAFAFVNRLAEVAGGRKQLRLRE